MKENQLQLFTNFLIKTELIDKYKCDDEFIQRRSIYERECDKSCDVGGYLDYANFKCRKRLIDKLFEKCVEDIEGMEETI